MLQAIIFRFATSAFSSAEHFIIKKHKYFLPAKPKRLTNSYLLFSNQIRSTLTGKMVQNSKAIGQQWKNLSPQAKKVYEDKVNLLKAQHEAEVKSYQLKYEQPFKNSNLNIYSYTMQKVYQSAEKPKSISQGAQKVKQLVAKMTPQQKKKLQEQIAEKKQQCQKNIQKFKIPVLEHNTLRKYMLAHSKDKKLSELTEAQRTKLQNSYAQQTEKHQIKLRNFALNFNLTLVEFNHLLTLASRRQSRQKNQQLKVKKQKLQADVSFTIQALAKEGKIGKVSLKSMEKKLKNQQPEDSAKTTKKPKVQAKRVRKTTTGVKKSSTTSKSRKVAGSAQVKVESGSQAAQNATAKVEQKVV